MTTVWSTQQEEIFNWFATPIALQTEKALVARARAGTGKSTTIREGVKRAPEKNILVAAFSKDIQLAMDRAMQFMPDGETIDPRRFNGQVKTLHAVGYAGVRLARPGIKVEMTYERAAGLAQKVCGISTPDPILKLVSKLHTLGRETAPHATKLGDLTAIAINFDCMPEEQYEEMGFGLEYVELKALAAMELASKVQAHETIDGSDMIFLP